MPDTTGHFLIKHVKEYFPDCRIIAMSSDHDALEDAMRFGACECLKKPFEIQEFIEKLNLIAKKL